MKRRVKAGCQLVVFLYSAFHGKYSKKFLRKALEANACKVNGELERFATRQLRQGDWVEFSFPLMQKGSERFSILLETDEFLCVNKPSSWVCSLEACHKAFGKGTYLVHRLDKNTTGVLLIAKSHQVQEEFIELFRQRQIKKTYLALVDGILNGSGTRRSFLAKKEPEHGQRVVESHSHGQEAITHWKALAKGNLATLVECDIPTGRMHQIRVHFAEMGHPLILDPQYTKSYRAKFTAQRPLLHAWKISFMWKEELIRVEAPIPEDLLFAMGALRVRNPFDKEQKEKSWDSSQEGKDSKERE